MWIILQIESTFVVKALKNNETAICTKTFFKHHFVFLSVNLNSVIQVRFK